MSNPTVYKTHEALVARVRLSVTGHECLADAVVQIAKAEATAGMLNDELYQMHLSTALTYLDKLQTMVFEAKAKVEEAQKERPVEEGGDL